MSDKAINKDTDKPDNKKWYKKGWGLVVAILFFPIFLIWYAWAESTWSKGVKIGVTVVMSMILLSAMSTSNVDNVPDVSTTDNAKEEVKEEPKADIVFDAPSLFGKDIDEIRKELGEPSDSSPEPNQKQLDLGTTSWDNTFKKGDYFLLISFNPITRTVEDYFISSNDGGEEGENRGLLLEVGNLSESSSDYSIEGVGMMIDPSKITGIIIKPN